MPPFLSHSEAAELLQRHWGLTGALTELGSFEDQNFAVAPDGDDAARYVLKVNGPERSVSLELEHMVLRGLAATDLPYDVPLPIPTETGEETVAHGPDRVRLLGWVPGTPLAEVADQHAGWLRQLGTLAAATGQALAGLAPTVAAVDCKWDPRLAGRVVAGVLADDPPPDEAQAEALARALEPLAALDGTALPRQLIHCDITDVNTLVTGDALTGLIDFGDIADTWRVCDLAVSAHAVLARHAGDALAAMLEVVGGYHEAAPLSEAEADALWPLILARAATCAALSTRHLRLTPEQRLPARLPPLRLAGAHAPCWPSRRTSRRPPSGSPPAWHPSPRIPGSRCGARWTPARSPTRSSPACSRGRSTSASPATPCATAPGQTLIASPTPSRVTGRRSAAGARSA